MQQARALNTPMNDLIAVYVANCLTEARGDVLWTQGDNVPFFHFQPKIVVSTEQTQSWQQISRDCFGRDVQTPSLNFLIKSSSMVFPTT